MQKDIRLFSSVSTKINFNPVTSIILEIASYNNGTEYDWRIKKNDNINNEIWKPKSFNSYFAMFLWL